MLTFLSVIAMQGNVSSQFIFSAVLFGGVNVALYNSDKHQLNPYNAELFL